MILEKIFLEKKKHILKVKTSYSFGYLENVTLNLEGNSFWLFKKGLIFWIFGKREYFLRHFRRYYFKNLMSFYFGEDIYKKVQFLLCFNGNNIWARKWIFVNVRTYVFHMLRTYVMMLCNWLIF